MTIIDDLIHAIKSKSELGAIKGLISALLAVGINTKDDDGYTALHCAAGIGHANVVKELTLIDMRIVFRDTDHEVPAVAKANNVPHIDEFFSMPKDQISDAPMA